MGSYTPPQALYGLPGQWTEIQQMKELQAGDYSAPEASITLGGPYSSSYSAGMFVPDNFNFQNGGGTQKFGQLTAGVVNVGYAPASSNPTITSGAVYQNTAGRYVYLYIPVTYNPTASAAATAAFALGASSTPATIFTNSEPAGIAVGRVDTLTLSIPPGWYYSLTATNATIGTVTEVQQ